MARHVTCRLKHMSELMRAKRNIVVTGSHGFIGRNLVVRLNELPDIVVSSFERGDDVALLPDLIAHADAVIHLAGENRPLDEASFSDVNTGLTIAVCEAIRRSRRRVPLVFASSTQAELDNPYGRSKLAAEHAVRTLSEATGNSCVIFRLPGVFGKWCKPNYNSVVATFCHNIARGLPIKINSPEAKLQLVYIDDVVSYFVDAIGAITQGLAYGKVKPVYKLTLGNLADRISSFCQQRPNLFVERVGAGLDRALYATYVSYLPTKAFSYKVPQYSDARGIFVEMLKTPDCGQVSYFTAPPGITRGGHYHHTKTEKFLVIKGVAKFRFRYLLTNEVVELQTSGGKPEVVDTIPGWIHDVTNIGDEELIVMVWANENFDRQRPDTVASKV